MRRVKELSMIRLFWRLAPEMVLCLAIAVSGLGSVGCSDPDNSVKAGPPVLTTWSVVDNATGASLDVTADGSPVQVGGFVHLNALFDRLLDPTTVTALDGGVDQGTPDAVTVTVTPALAASASFSVNSIYTPNGADPSMVLVFSPGPSIATTGNPTFPSGSTITATMDKTKVRSKKGEAFTASGDLASGKLVFQTLPFSVTVAAPMGDADPDAGVDAGPPPVSPMMQAVTMTFTNVPNANIQGSITVTVNGAAYTNFAVAPESNPTVVDVTPTTDWPPNATIVVSIGASATDALGIAIDSGASASFTTSGS
jgi:hypothetical protein